MRKTAVNVCRLLLAVAFILSGFVKAVDPLGTQYKIHDYLGAMGLAVYVPDFMTLSASVTLSATEFFLGICLLFAIRRRLVSLITMIFLVVMTLLTLWLALANPISDCGCFGDALVLTNWQTFWKNVVLLAASVLVWRNPLDMARFISRSNQWIVMNYSAFFILVIIAGRSLYTLPQFDFRHYHIGTNAYSTNTLPKRYSRKEAPSYYFAGGFNFSHAIGKHNSVHGDFIGFNLILLGFSTRIGVFALNTSYGFGINSGDEFTDSNKNNPKTFKHNSFMSFVDGSILYRPAICIHDILNKWAVQPEFGLGVHALDDAILYYSVGIRYEKSTARQEWNMRQPYGIIDGWSIGLASKWSGINFKGITLDIRWAIHA